jgi:GNAT superfamily N-acetyltransferase
VSWTIREFDPARDAAAVLRMDTSFETDRIYTLRRDADALHLEQAAAPSVKRFPIDLASDGWDEGYVALRDGEVRGFVAVGLSAWNRRMIVSHFYVDRAHRRLGAGRELMRVAMAWGREVGAQTAWVETSNVNVPGIRAYRRFGFELCGFDATLYDGTPARGEFAVFLSRAIGAGPDAVSGSAS